MMKKKTIPVGVRKALAEGKIRTANELLKGTYSISGTVVKGQQLGRTLGFPTANIKLNEESPLFLANGVYAVLVLLEGIEYRGMANIGIRPTLDQHILTIEVNIFDFTKEIYHKEIEVSFVERIRDEQKFPGLNELKEQIRRDMEQIRELFSLRDHPDSNTL